jgi:hypothetical protein
VSKTEKNQGNFYCGFALGNPGNPSGGRRFYRLIGKDTVESGFPQGLILLKSGQAGLDLDAIEYLRSLEHED